MRILIISDIHANPWALEAVAKAAHPFDHIICAGDVTNYGPEPHLTIDWMREHEVITVRGNHDHAVAHGADPKASPSKRTLALSMRDWTREQLDAGDVNYLIRLPLSLTWEIDRTRFFLVHGTPQDPLYDYRLVPGLSEASLVEALEGLGMEGIVLVLGHTHLPFVREYGRTQIVNPGSLGQPLDGKPTASYAVWEEGRIHLRRIDYDKGPLLEMIHQQPLPKAIIDDLAAILIRGKIE